MKRLLLTFMMAGAALATPAFAGDVGVGVSLGQPGFYGQIELGNAGPPPVVYTRPVIINRGPPGVVVEPLYLHVPSEHSRNWRHYCGRYDACGRQVYFVKDDWYNKVYAPHYREQHRDDHRDFNDHHDSDHHDYDHHDNDDHHDDHRDNH